MDPVGTGSWSYLFEKKICEILENSFLEFVLLTVDYIPISVEKLKNA